MGLERKLQHVAQVIFYFYDLFFLFKISFKNFIKSHFFNVKIFFSNMLLNKVDHVDNMYTYVYKYISKCVCIYNIIIFYLKFI